MTENIPERPCEICGMGNQGRAMTFRGERYCSENHRKELLNRNTDSSTALVNLHIPEK